MAGADASSALTRPGPICEIFAMRRPPDRTARCRAALVVAALYGLLLQVFLVSLQPLPAFASTDGVICAAHDGAPADDRAACPQQLCCLAVHLGQPLLAPAPAAVALVTPRRRITATDWRMADRPPVRGPPNRAAPPRGPPAA